MEELLKKLSNLFKSKRYFIICYTAYDLKNLNYTVESTFTSINGYPNRENLKSLYMIDLVKKTDIVFKSIIFTNIIELSKKDYMSWTKKELTINQK
jgi:hypothetical protein